MIAHQNVCMTKLIPYDGGCELHQVLDVDPSGWIPDFVKGYLSQRHSMNACVLFIVVDKAECLSQTCLFTEVFTVCSG